MIISYSSCEESNRAADSSLTSLSVVVHIFIDGVEEVLLLAAELPGPQNVSDTLMQVQVLTLKTQQVTVSQEGTQHSSSITSNKKTKN